MQKTWTPWYTRPWVARLAILGGVVCLLWAVAGCGRSANVTGSDVPADEQAPVAGGANVDTRPYWALNVGEVWHFTREGHPTQMTDIEVVEDENGCKALHFVKNHIDTYHAAGQQTNLLWYVDERADGLYANNCRGGFGKDDFPDDIRSDMHTGKETIRLWYIGAQPYLLSPWVVQNGSEIHGRQDYLIRYPWGDREASSTWVLRYDLMPDGLLRIQFDEEHWNVGEDWYLERGVGLVGIDSWADMSRTRINVRLVRLG